MAKYGEKDPLIQKYRGHEIYFDIDKENFYTPIDNERSEKKTYKAIKASIDDYIKENKTFEPFNIVNAPSYGSYDLGDTIKIVGIRKDGRFIMERKGKQSQLSEYDEKNYMLEEPENEKIFAKIALIESQIDDLRDQKREEVKKLKVTLVKDIKSQYIIK